MNLDDPNDDKAAVARATIRDLKNALGTVVKMTNELTPLGIRVEFGFGPGPEGLTLNKFEVYVPFDVKRLNS